MNENNEHIETFYFDESRFDINCWGRSDRAHRRLRNGVTGVPGEWIYETNRGKRVLFADEFEVGGDTAIAIRLAEERSGLKCADIAIVDMRSAKRVLSSDCSA